eukprot:SAG11_NODE_3499_length_2409_cov_9.797403_1_plen_133_part_10
MSIRHSLIRYATKNFVPSRYFFVRYRVSASGNEIYRILVPWSKSFGSGKLLYRLCTPGTQIYRIWELRNAKELRHVKVDPEPSVLVGFGTPDATTTRTHGSTQALTSDVRPPLALHLDHAGSVSTAAGHFCCH